MYTITKVSKNTGDNIYDVKIPLSQKEYIIKKYGLEEYGLIKEYWINNVNIVNSEVSSFFNYILEGGIEFDKKTNTLIENYEKLECVPFNFYNTDIEEDYILYQKEKDNYLIKLKQYKGYLVLEVCGEILSEIKNNII